MARLIDLLTANAADILFNFAAFLIIYLVARLMRVSPLVALCFGVLPPLLAYLVQHPNNPTSILSLLR
jgi:hypothetical protein